MIKSAVSFFLVAALGASAFGEVVNGLAAFTEDGEELHKPVASLLIGLQPCSGVMVGANVMLTASHCFEFSRFKGAPLQNGYRAYAPAAVIVNGRPERTQAIYRLSENPSYDDDLAVIVFTPKAGVPAEIYKISRTPVRSSFTVEVAGWSQETGYAYDPKAEAGLKLLPGGGHGKRYGTNTVLDLYKGAIRTMSNLTDAAEGASGRDAGLANGDSGGALIHDGFLVGIANSTYSLELQMGASKKNWKMDMYVDLTNSKAMDFLLKLKEAGVPIEFGESGSPVSGAGL